MYADVRIYGCLITILKVRVMLTGLKSKQSLNGSTGTCRTKKATSSGIRWVVALEGAGGGELAVKPVNLTLAPVVRRRHRVPYDAYVRPGGGGGGRGPTDYGQQRQPQRQRRRATPIRHPCTIATAKATWAKQGYTHLPTKHISERVRSELMAQPVKALKRQCKDRGIHPLACLEKKDYVDFLDRFHDAFQLRDDGQSLLRDYSLLRKDTFEALNKVRANPKVLLPVLRKELASFGFVRRPSEDP